MIRKFLQPNRFTAKALSVLLTVALGGMFCLCCFGSARNEAQADSCPLSKSNHCKSLKNKNSESSSKSKLLSNRAECCELKLNIFVATLDKSSLLKENATVTEDVRPVRFAFAETGTSHESAVFVYRPPPLDQSFSHVRNCVFRI